MGNCFVMQPFDKGGPFDRRYEDVLVPAIKQAGLTPFRVDRAPGVVIPIESIETEIRGADVCLADVTLDNANVWFELGFALAANREVCIICSAERKTPYPFDIQHRRIISYEPGAPSDFTRMGKEIVEQLRNLVKRTAVVRSAAAMPLAPSTQGLSVFERSALAIAMSTRFVNDPGPSAHEIKSRMVAAGFTDLAAGIAMESLIRSGYLEKTTAFTNHGDEYPAYMLTEKGVDWMLVHQGEFQLHQTEPDPPPDPF